MARAPDVIVDDSPLDSPGLNVPLRVGWLLRTCRLNSRVAPGLTGHRFADDLGVGAAMVTKWEKGCDAGGDPVAVAGYERLVKLPAGSLRAVVDIANRYFRYPVAPRLDTELAPQDLPSLSRWVEPAMTGSPTGVDWMRWADALADDGPLRLPDFVAEPVLHRLVGELARSVGGAFLTRYEVASRIRCGPYGDLLLDALLEHALADDAQVSASLLNVAGQHATAELFGRMTRLLLDPREAVFHGAAQSLVTMAARGLGRSEMRDAVPGLVAAYNDLAGDPTRHHHASSLLRNLPPGVLETARPALAKPLAPPTVAGGLPERRTTLGPAARSIAEAVKRDLPAPVDQVLERTIYEAMFDPRWPKAYIATLFLGCVPYADLVAQHVARLADRTPSRTVRDAASLLVLRLGEPATRDCVEQWVLGDDVRLQRTALVNLGMWEHDVDGALLEKLLAEDVDVSRLALYAAGMSGSPLLREWAEDPGKSDAVRVGARWWLAHGSRISEMP